ncbi:hypothetical protein BH09MYX1_BH09MYX1_09100 [soil metagenome]
MPVGLGERVIDPPGQLHVFAPSSQTASIDFGAPHGSTPTATQTGASEMHATDLGAPSGVRPPHANDAKSSEMPAQTSAKRSILPIVPSAMAIRYR